MKISIAMATYNGALYLKAQLQSFVDQTLLPDELIITDDCSTDETELVVRKFAENAPFKVKFYRNEENLGYCGNFNAALMKTTGDLVFLSDQDDVWFPEKIEHMLALAESNPKALLLMNDAMLADEHLNKVGLTKIGQIQSAGFSMQDFVMGCCCAIRRELLDLCMPIPGSFNAHDSWLVGIADGLEVKLVDRRVLQYYRRHDSNESQFAANSLIRMSRFRAFLHSARKIFDPEVELIENQKIEQLKIFEEGVKNIEERASSQYSRRLTRLMETTRGRYDWMEKRVKLRKKKIGPRVLAVLRLLINSEYNTYSGFKAFLRDLVG